MNTTTTNKVLMAVLFTALMVFGLKQLGGTIYHAAAPPHDKMGYLIETSDAEAPASGAGEVAAVSIGTLLATADATKGAAEAKACAACHDFTKGGPNKAGPNLWDVVERSIGTHGGFAYSEGAKAMTGQAWSYDALNEFIKAPKTYIKGTKMGYGGLKNDAKRANLIAYLASLSDAPKPFPAP